MTIRFEERAPYERGFAAVFDRRIAPELERLEAERLRLKRRGRILFGAATAAGALVGIAFTPLAPDLAIGFLMVLFPFLFGAGIGAVLMFTTGDKWEAGLTDLVVPVVCDFVGNLEYDRDAAAGFPTDRMRKLGVIGGYDSVRVSDRLDGRYRNVSFALVEAALLERYWDHNDKRRTRTVWSGLLFQIGVPVSAPGRILVAQDAGDLLNRITSWPAGDDGRGMPRVPFADDPRFEAAFEVHADDPFAAVGFLDAGFREALLEIAEAESTRPGAKGVAAGFEGDDFFLALSRRGPFLSIGSIQRPVTDVAEEIHGVFDDLAVVFRIINRLHGDRPDTDPVPAGPSPGAPVAPAA